MLLVRPQPCQVVVEVREPGCIVAGSRLRLQQAIRARQDDVRPGRDVGARRRDQLVIAVDGQVSTRPFPPAQGSWIESAFVGQ